MRFMHVADVHLGANPEMGNVFQGDREKELWESFSHLIDVCNEEEIDVLLIAGDLFHRQPLLRELKEVNYLFSQLTKTEVVLIAGNHDFIKKDSYYPVFQWNSNVHTLFGREFEEVILEELELSIQGISYYSKEIYEERYTKEHLSVTETKYHILLAHGGDEKHIPIKRRELVDLNFDYIALGHIHKPGTLIENYAVYAGALEPIDRNDIGAHGYVLGEITEHGVQTMFVPCALREYMHEEIQIDTEMTNGMLKSKIKELIQRKGNENIYKILLKGYRDSDIMFDVEELKKCGNILEVENETVPAYDFEQLRISNEENLLGKYIAYFQNSKEGSIEYQALYEGVQALLETRG